MNLSLCTGVLACGLMAQRPSGPWQHVWPEPRIRGPLYPIPGEIPVRLVEGLVFFWDTELEVWYHEKRVNFSVNAAARGEDALVFVGDGGRWMKTTLQGDYLISDADAIDRVAHGYGNYAAVAWNGTCFIAVRDDGVITAIGSPEMYVDWQAPSSFESSGSDVLELGQGFGGLGAASDFRSLHSGEWGWTDVAANPETGEFAVVAGDGTVGIGGLFQPITAPVVAPTPSVAPPPHDPAERWGLRFAIRLMPAPMVAEGAGSGYGRVHFPGTEVSCLTQCLPSASFFFHVEGATWSYRFSLSESGHWHDHGSRYVVPGVVDGPWHSTSRSFPANPAGVAAEHLYPANPDEYYLARDPHRLVDALDSGSHSAFSPQSQLLTWDIAAVFDGGALLTSDDAVHWEHRGSSEVEPSRGQVKEGVFFWLGQGFRGGAPANHLLRWDPAVNAEESLPSIDLPMGGRIVSWQMPALDSHELVNARGWWQHELPIAQRAPLYWTGPSAASGWQHEGASPEETMSVARWSKAGRPTATLLTRSGMLVDVDGPHWGPEIPIEFDFMTSPDDEHLYLLDAHSSLAWRIDAGGNVEDLTADDLSPHGYEQVRTVNGVDYFFPTQEKIQLEQRRYADGGPLALTRARADGASTTPFVIAAETWAMDIALLGDQEIVVTNKGIWRRDAALGRFDSTAHNRGWRHSAWMEWFWPDQDPSHGDRFYQLDFGWFEVWAGEDNGGWIFAHRDWGQLWVWPDWWPWVYRYDTDFWENLSTGETK